MKSPIPFAILLAGCASSAQVERVEPLGGGYDAAIIAEPSSSSFESVGHFQYLRKDGRKITNIGAHDASPDGRYISYQEGSSARIFIIHKESGSIRAVTTASPGLVREFNWSKEAGYLWLDIYDKDSIRLKIPEFRK